jgi:uncharacterized protein (DUF169 family)
MNDKYTRREALGIGLGTAVIGISGAAALAAQTAGKPAPAEETGSPDLNTFRKYGEDMETALLLRTSPIALKMLEKEADIPDGAFRPKRDGKYHIAQCQAFSMSRREGKTVAMLKEDHWCPTALMAYGMVKTPDSMAKLAESYSSFEYGKYVGVATAPLKSASFIPDVVIVYLNPAQLRGLLMPMMLGDSSPISGHFLLPSCGHCVVDPMITGNYCVVLPDPGEYQRALTQEAEIIFAMPRKKVPRLTAGLGSEGRGYSHRNQYMSMLPDFEQPQFYKDLFKSWGLDVK